MQFLQRRRRTAPTVIIISLIDVLIVVLIFLMVTTTFKQLPALKLALPESKDAKPGASENALVVTISKQGPLYLKAEPVTLEALGQRLTQAVRENPQATLAIRADKEAPFGEVIKVMDAAKEAKIRVASAYLQAEAP
jgi:biopolymer transport protein ExbD